MANATALLLLSLSSSLLLTRGPDISVPFTHDFDYGLYNWTYKPIYWAWTAFTREPNFHNVPYFYNDGNYVWTQDSIQTSFLSTMAFSSSPIVGVDESTKFYFHFWFSTTNSTENCGIRFYALDMSATEASPPLQTVSSSSDSWRDVMIDCQDGGCCISFPCKLLLLVIGSTGGHYGDGLVAIRCVSTQSDGCGELPTPPTTTSTTPLTTTSTTPLITTSTTLPLPTTLTTELTTTSNTPPTTTSTTSKTTQLTTTKAITKRTTTTTPTSTSTLTTPAATTPTTTFAPSGATFTPTSNLLVAICFAILSLNLWFSVIGAFGPPHN